MRNEELETDYLVVGAGQLVETRIRPGHIASIAPQRHRADPVQGGWLMETDVGIGVDPVPARGVTAIDDRDRRLGMREQRVGEGHPGGPGTDHEIVRLEFFVSHEKANVVVGGVVR